MVRRVCIILSHHLYQQCILLVANLVMSTRVRFEFTVFCFHHFDFWKHGFKCRSTYIQRRIQFLLLQMSYLSQRTIVIYVYPIRATTREITSYQLFEILSTNVKNPIKVQKCLVLSFTSKSLCVRTPKYEKWYQNNWRKKRKKPVKVQSMIDLLRSYSRSTKLFSIS